MVQLSILAELLDKDLTRALEAMTDIRLSLVDLKGHIYGTGIEHLGHAERVRLREDLTRHNVEVFCFATMLGYHNVLETSEQDFRQSMRRGIDNLAQTIRIVRPQSVRLLACKMISADKQRMSMSELEDRSPWVFEVYREAIADLNDLGLAVTIENEPESILSSPQAVVRFFDRLKIVGDAGFTWDIQNMWQAGSFPTLTGYQQMKSTINYVHLKGGRWADQGAPSLTYRSVLEDADWPVRELVSQVIQDGVSPVICLNTSHGTITDNYPFVFLKESPLLSRVEAMKDAAFLRANFGEIR